MGEICGDGRFEIIEKAKQHLLNSTNIHTSEDEMKVLDNFLFRCWQMGWLDKYAEPCINSSEIKQEIKQDLEPTSSKMEQVGDCETCKHYHRQGELTYGFCGDCIEKGMCKYEPYISKENE